MAFHDFWSQFEEGLDPSQQTGNTGFPGPIHGTPQLDPQAPMLTGGGNAPGDPATRAQLMPNEPVPSASTIPMPYGAPAPGAPPPTGQSGSGQGDPEAFRAAWYASPYPKNTEGLKQFVAANPQFGATVTGSKGSKVIVGGRAFQAVRSAGINGGIGPAWDDLGPEGGGGPGGGTLGQLGYGFGSSMAPWTENFTAPTAEQALNDPGVAFGLSEANRMMQLGPAAKGTLLNGRVQQAIGASNVGNAMQAYGDVYARARDQYGIRRTNFMDNQDRPFDKNYRLAELGRPT